MSQAQQHIYSNNFIQHKSGLDVSLLLKQLEVNPQLWNLYSERKIAPDSPHAEMSDIWVRYRDKAELQTPEDFKGPHISNWYPCRYALSEVERIAMYMISYFKATQLGGILITKIPPGGEIKPHDDRGSWHAEFYNTKIYVPLQSNPGCINICEDDVVNMKVGDVWEFDNLKTHSVQNNGNTDRITLIICLRCE